MLLKSIYFYVVEHGRKWCSFGAVFNCSLWNCTENQFFVYQLISIQFMRRIKIFATLSFSSNVSNKLSVSRIRFCWDF